MPWLSAEETVQVRRWRKALPGRGAMWAEAQRRENTAVWEYCVCEWGLGGDREIVRAISGRASFGPAKEFRFYLEGTGEPLKEF